MVTEPDVNVHSVTKQKDTMWSVYLVNSNEHNPKFKLLLSAYAFLNYIHVIFLVAAMTM